jgi:choline dehydrogenase-like flavoprotein
VHGQITTLTTAIMHPIIQQLPFDLRTSLLVARATRTALGVVNMNFHDSRREGNWLEVADCEGGTRSRLHIHYAPTTEEPARLEAALRRVRKMLWHLGCIVPPGMQHVRPMGASVHYAGVFPMTRGGGNWTTDRQCRSRAFPNLLLVDGSTFPFLPAKNLTFTLMANATRIATEAL